MVLAVFCQAVLFISILGAQENKARLPVVLERANVLKNRAVGDENIKELIGNVYITRGEMGIECEHAYQYQQAGKIIFIQDVHYADSLRDMWADRVTYFIEADSLKAVGSVKIVQDKYEAYSRRAYYSEERRNVYLEESVKLIDLENFVVLTGRRGFGDETLEYARVTGDAKMVKSDSLGESETTIISLKIENFQKESRAQATDSVKVYQEDITGDCGKFQYFLDQRKALMELNPMIFRQSDELKGDSIYLYFFEDKLDRIEIFGEASVLSPLEDGGEGEFNRMYGNRMFIEIFEDKIKKMTVIGNARSIYYLYEDGESKGVNSASGDRIYLRFHEGKLEAINVAGGTEGTYYPSDYGGEIE